MNRRHSRNRREANADFNHRFASLALFAELRGESIQSPDTASGSLIDGVFYDRWKCRLRETHVSGCQIAPFTTVMRKLCCVDQFSCLPTLTFAFFPWLIRLLSRNGLNGIAVAAVPGAHRTWVILRHSMRITRDLALAKLRKLNYSPWTKQVRNLFRIALLASKPF